MVIKKWFFMLVVATFLSTYAENLSEYQRALNYLTTRNEVYFIFDVNSEDELQQIASMVSIDRVDGKQVTAYANTEQFNSFLTRGVSYTILTPPSLQGPAPEMSTYDNFDIYRSQINKYPTYDAYVSMMKAFETQSPDKCKYVEAGKSVKSKLILFAVLTNTKVVGPKPRIILTSTMHGDETGGYVMYLRLIQSLLAGYGTDRQATTILDSLELWINPLHNPDGAYNSGNNSVQGATRANANGQDLNRNYPDVQQPNPSMQPEVKAVHGVEVKQRFVLGVDTHGDFNVVLYPWAYVKQVVPDQKTWQYLCGILSANNGMQVTSPSVGFQYLASGPRFDWPYYGYAGRVMCLELPTKLTPESQLDSYYSKYMPAHFKLFLETLNGLRGKITDSKSGAPIIAKVAIENHDGTYGAVQSYDKYGDFYHPVVQGTYTVTVTPTDKTKYDPKTFSNVQITNGKPTVLDIKLDNKVTSLVANQNTPIQGMNIVQSHNTITFYIPQLSKNASISIYSLDGKQITEFPAQSHYISWDLKDKSGSMMSPGCYLIQCASHDKLYFQKFTISR